MKFSSRAFRPRRRLSPTEVDLTSWATVDAAQLSKRDKDAFKKRCDAVATFQGGHTAQAAADVMGCNERNFRRLWERCLTLAPDGRVWGYRALVPRLRICAIERVAPLRAIEGKPCAGFGGAFGALLREHPSIERGMVQALGRTVKDVCQPVTMIGRELHKLFIELCGKANIGPDAYPLNTIQKGRRALHDWVRRDYIPRYASQFVKGEHGQDAATTHDFQKDGDARRPAAQPWEEWQIDSVKIDVSARYELLSSDCVPISLDLARTVGLLCKDTGTGAGVAWQHVMAREVNLGDLLDLLWQALSGERKPKADVPDCEHMDGAGYPTTVLPQLRFAPPRRIKLDNALAHLADALRNALGNVCGIEVVLGEPKTPLARAAVEAEFSALARKVLHKLPATTGSGPNDPKRKKAAIVPEGRIRIEELDHLIDVYFANRNGTPHHASNYVSPLERLTQAARYGLLNPIVLPPDKRHAHFFGLRLEVTVRAELTKGRRPFVNFLGKRYQGPSLKSFAGLVGTKLIARASTRDLRTLILFDIKGVELGALRAEGKWGVLPHDYRIRKLFLHLRQQNMIGKHAEDDPLRALFTHLNNGAPRDAKQAAQLAHLLGYLRGYASELPSGVLSDIGQQEALQVAANDLSLLPILSAATDSVSSAIALAPAEATSPLSADHSNAKAPRTSAQPNTPVALSNQPIASPISPPAARPIYLLNQRSIRR